MTSDSLGPGMVTALIELHFPLLVEPVYDVQPVRANIEP